MCRDNAFRLSVCNSLTFESLDPKRKFILVCRNNSESLGKIRISKSSSQGQDHNSKNVSAFSCFRVVYLQLKDNLVLICSYLYSREAVVMGTVLHRDRL